MANKNSQRQRILNMVKDKSMTPDEALELLEALESGAPEEAEAPIRPAPVQKGKYKFLKVEIFAPGGQNGKGKANVRVNIPLSLAKTGISLAQKFIPEQARETMEQNNVSIDDIAQILDHLDDFENGDIVNIVADEGAGQNTNVRVYLE